MKKQIKKYRSAEPRVHLQSLRLEIDTMSTRSRKCISAEPGLEVSYLELHLIPSSDREYSIGINIDFNRDQ